MNQSVNQSRCFLLLFKPQVRMKFCFAFSEFFFPCVGVTTSASSRAMQFKQPLRREKLKVHNIDASV